MAEPTQDHNSYSNIDKNILERNCCLLIRDLHNSDKRGSLFYFKDNTPFLKVLICGKITDVYDQNENYCVVVDDGTGELVCLINISTLEALESLEREFCALVDHHKAKLENDFTWASVLLGQRLKKDLKNASCVKTLKFKKLVGQVVFVTGKLRKYEKLFLFVEKIRIAIEGSIALDEYLKNVQQVYDKYYS